VTPFGAAPHPTCTLAVGPSAAEAACHVVRQSITRCCVADHANDPSILATWLANKTPENLAAWITAPGAAAWGAYRGETMVGFALLTQASLALCYLLPEALHQGVGRGLLQNAEAHARKAGVTALALDSTRTAEAFYRRNGFEPVGAPQAWAGLQAQPMRKVL
jgi:GNAT superfamily N-acetyltransferase